MNYRIKKQCFRKINSFYYNVAKKYKYRQMVFRIHL